MTAIIGIYRRDGTTVNPSQLQQMTDRLSHRGPDGAGIWNDGAIGLGHRMLWTTPESLHERLPLVSDDKLRIITADARIDNRDELLAALDLTSAPSGLLPDSALILGSYERWGASCVDHLLGDFAFAIWDKEKRHLFCARDHMGVKPFYYYQSDDIFAFASEIKALSCLSEVPRQVDEEQISLFLASLPYDRNRTPFADICRLPAAHVLIVESNHLDFYQYWSLDPTYELRLESDEAYAQRFHDIFMEAIRCRLRSAFPVGSHLSGGLDSSTVVCTIREALQHPGNDDRTPGVPFHTFSAVFDDVPESDERSYINAVLAKGDMEPHYVHPDQVGTLSDIKQILWHEEEPFGIPNMFMSWELSRMAHDVGVRILLDGECGDTVLSHARGWTIELARTGKWGTLMKELNERAGVTGSTRSQLVFNELLLPLFPLKIRKIWWWIRKGPPSLSRLIYLSPTIIDGSRLKGRMESLMLRFSPRMRLRERHYTSLTSAFIQDIFEVLDKEAAAFSFEMRHPFYDRRLVEFCLALPVEQKIRNGYTRYIMRNALAPYLPDEIRRRGGKATFTPNFRHCLLTFDRSRIENVLDEGPPLDAYLNMPKIREAYQSGPEGRTDELFMLWKVAVLASWLEQMEDSQRRPEKN